MIQKKFSEGFALLGAMLIVLVVVVAGCAGWYIWRVQHKKSTDGHEAAQGDATSGGTKNAALADPSQNGKYLVVKEWGVRFLLPQDLQGDMLTNVSGTSGSGTVIFASRKLNTLTGDDSCSLIKQSDGSYSGGIQAQLDRMNPKTYAAPEALDYYKSQLTYIKTIGDYEYYFRKPAKDPPITCLTGRHDNLAGTEQAISDQLKAAFGQLETIP